MQRILGVLALCAAAALAPVAAAQAAPTVRSAGFSPARVVAGSTVTVGGKVANRGDKARTVIVRFGLRAEGRTHAVGLARVRARAHNKTRYRVRADLPGSFAAGRYAVVVCAGRACRTARGRLTVTAPPRCVPTTPSVAPSEQPPPPAAAPAPAPPAAAPIGVVFPAGARSGGDRLFPQIGNGGYDARHYDLRFDYDAATGALAAQARMDAVATQNLGQFSMDFQGMTVDRVRIDGIDVGYTREVPAQTSGNAEGIASKLVIDPPVGIVAGSPFTVTVDYHGVPDTVVDPDGAVEGWIPVRDGAVVVCQPIGCQSVFPQNNVPYDKATFDFTITVPAGMSGVGNGELTGTSTSGGRTTWRWHMGRPISTYLTTATVGDYDATQTHDTFGREINNFVDRTITDRSQLDPILAEQQSMIDFIAARLGPYPFDSYGAIVADASFIEYALEVATKPFYDRPDDAATTHMHELLHQWFGDTVTYRQIQDVWIHEGLASFFEVYWDNVANGDPTTTATAFDTLYTSAPPAFWTIAPATPTAEQLFSGSVYYRGFMTYEGLREIVGDTTFFDILRTIVDRYRYGAISSAEVEQVAEEVSGRDLHQFFQDYLYGTARPPLPGTYV
jgi:aminopeptidase N